MEKICLIADSACDITREMAREYDIRVLPVSITYAGGEHKEFEEIKIEEYWDFLEQNEELPSTAQVSPVQHLEAYEKAKADGYTKIIELLINAAGSGTFASATVARDMYYAEHGHDIEICLIDSKNYSITYGKALILARRAINNGASFEQAIEIINEHISRVEAAAAVFSLRQLRKSGRIGGASALAGALLGIKPLIHLCDGSVDVVDKVRGDKQIIKKLCDYVDSRMDADYDQSEALYLLCSKIPEEYIVQVEAHLCEKCGVKSIERIPLGCSITTNTGPNILGIVYYGKKRA